MKIENANQNEVVIGSLPSGDDQTRITLVMVQGASPGSNFQLRQESWSDAVGWFEQSRIAMTSEQFAALKNTLASTPARTRRKPAASDATAGRSILPFKRVS